MRYLANSVDPDVAAPGTTSNWMAPEFEDATWSLGSYGVGYEEGGDAAAMLETIVPELTASVFTRTEFVIESLVEVQSLHVGADFDDGVVVYLNGVEIARDNVPGAVGAPVPWNAETEDDHESSNGTNASYDPVWDVTQAALPLLEEGSNVLAVGAWNTNATSSDLALVPFLSINRPPPISGTEICGLIEGAVTLTRADSPYVVLCDAIVAPDATLTIEAGVELHFENSVELRVEGRLQALGSNSERILLTARGDRWSGVHIDHSDDGVARASTMRNVDWIHTTTALEVEDTGESDILVEDCRFDLWNSKALTWDGSNGLVVRGCDFGLDTPLEEADHETINGYRAGTIVEYCRFGRRRDYNDVIDLGDTSWDGPVPILRYNTFFGGDDDAIDLDGAAGWIIGNLIMDHWPGPDSSSRANGGGITGQDSDTVVINNIVYRCFHGIGYKNAATPLIMNNLVLDCHVGITFYKDECDEDSPHATLHNNISWNNRNEETEEATNLVLHGRWWSTYCQDEGDQATADVSYSVIGGGWPGIGNLDVDPRIAAPQLGDFSLLPDSPALDSGLGGPILKEGVSSERLAAALAIDFDGAPRFDLDCVDDSGSGSPSYVDRGPMEAQVFACLPPGTRVFRRGDTNEDGTYDISDALANIFILFLERPTPCEDAQDVNDSGEHDLADVLYLLNFLFLQGPAIPPPSVVAGIDPTDDLLGCGEG